MAHLCPWWFNYVIDNPLRFLLHSPLRLFRPYLTQAASVLDIGSGMGWASLGMARLIGPRGRVFALDVQRQSLDSLMKRAEKKGVNKQIVPILSSATDFDLPHLVDFALAFWSVHEIPEHDKLFALVRKNLTPNGKFLIAEPRFHVTKKDFAEIMAEAGNAGLEVVEEPEVAWSHTALFKRNE